MKLRAEFAARRQEAGTATMKLDTAAPGGVRVLKIEDLGFSWGSSDDSSFSGSGEIRNSRMLFSNFTADVLRGERIGILGRNGAGKTTLLKLLVGALKPTVGSVTIGTNVRMAFFDQLRSEIRPELTVGENVASDRDEVIVGGVKKHVYWYLADFLFAPERVRTPVKALSGGERARLMLAKLFLEPANLLVMDEPTNDLDVETLELLEEQLLAYKGTLLLVSHDREFLDNVVTSTMVLEGDGLVRQYPGGYEDYLRQRGEKKVGKRGGGGESEDAASPAPTPRPPFPQAPRKLSYKEQREFEALPDRIDALEREIAEIEALLSDGQVFVKDPLRGRTAAERLPLAKVELEASVERWAELGERASV